MASVHKAKLESGTGEEQGRPVASVGQRGKHQKAPKTSGQVNV